MKNNTKSKQYEVCLAALIELEELNEMYSIENMKLKKENQMLIAENEKLKDAFEKCRKHMEIL